MEITLHAGDVVDEEVWPEEPLKDALTGKCGTRSGQSVFWLPA